MTKTILITGSTDGIGLLTAKTLAEQGHKVLVHGRSAEKLKLAAAQMPGDCIALQADLSSLDETRQLARQVGEHVQQLDVLINNAGVLKAPTPILPNGQDIRFVVNTVSPFLLTELLLPLIPEDGRILNLSSAAQAPVQIDALMGERRLAEDMTAYAQSKRAITAWSAAMAQSHPQGPVVISVNPGSLLATKMVKEGFGIAGNDLRIGSDILCQLALSPEFADKTGRYWDNDAGRFGAVDLSQADEIVAAVRQLIA